MKHYLADNYVRSQGLYRLEYLEWQIENDDSFSNNNLSLETMIHYSFQDGYQDLKEMLSQWFRSADISEEDVLEYLFMRAHPHLFEVED